MNFLLLWVLMGIAIVVVATNGWQLSPGKPVVIPDSALGQALFVCPAASKVFDGLAAEYAKIAPSVRIAFWVIFMLWAAIVGWVIYNSMLNDKFERKNFDLPIFLGKMLIFLFVIGTILLRTPNHFRAVYVRNTTGDFVLCERDTPGARAVRASALYASGK